MVFNPEEYYQKIHDRGLESDVYVDRLYQKALGEIEKNTIDMKEFSNYKEIDKDQRYVQKMKSKFDKEDTDLEKRDKKLATVLEAIINYQIDRNCCFGDEVHAIHTCEYDDIANGVDSILEVEEDKGQASHLAIAIDETFSAEKIKGEGGKIESIENSIRDGKLSYIKYFKSEFLGIKGDKKEVPKFVLGIDRNNLEQLAELWYSGKNRTLSQHPSQIMFLDQILAQLEYFKNFAEGVKQEKIAQKYNYLIKLFEEINESMSEQRAEILSKKENQEIIANDKVHQAIMNLKNT
jgi:hypothetical protein